MPYGMTFGERTANPPQDAVMTTLSGALNRSSHTNRKGRTYQLRVVRREAGRRLHVMCPWIRGATELTEGLEVRQKCLRQCVGASAPMVKMMDLLFSDDHNSS